MTGFCCRSYLRCDERRHRSAVTYGMTGFCCRSHLRCDERRHRGAVTYEMTGFCCRSHLRCDERRHCGAVTCELTEHRDEHGRSMLILGIDPGTAIMGYGLVDNPDDVLALVEYGTITTTPDQPMPQRLRSIFRQLSSILTRFHPDALAVEELFFSRNVTTALAVGQARGIVLLAAAEADIPVFEYKPQAVKQAIVGYGRADKSQVQQMVRMLLNLDQIPRPDDAADAIAIAVCHHHSARFNQLLARS